MSVTTSTGTPTGSYLLTITGTSTSPSLTHSATVTLVVNSAGFTEFLPLGLSVFANGHGGPFD